MSEAMTFQLLVWRQSGPDRPGKMVPYTVENVLPSMSILEMLDELNHQLTLAGKQPVEFDSDCREGICGTCGLVINGTAHGPKSACTTCELRMREFSPNAVITIEPFRADAFPIIKDLVVDRGALDRIIGRGGYTSVNAGSAPDANSILVGKLQAEKAMDAAACIGCGACVAACPNASASLFTAAKIAQFSYLPQGQVERFHRARRMVAQMDIEGFGNCSNHGECQAVCPKEIPIANIAIMRREYFKAAFVD
jgi:succinate dehydrogenase / fumarate reductase iron-sulfur subunit